MQGVEIKKVDPPASVEEAFQDVTSAQQDAEPRSTGRSAVAQQLLARAQGDASEFDKVYEEYKLAPEVTRRRLYYETMERVLSKNDKMIVESGNVTPYLPLPELKRRAQPPAQPQGGSDAMNSVFENYKALVIAAVIAVVALASVIVIIPETHQAVVIRTGQPNRVINQFRPDQPYGQTGAGINWRIPFAEQVQMIDQRVLDLDMERQQVLSNDQQRLEVDAYARFRIIDPVKMVRTAGTDRSV